MNFIDLEINEYFIEHNKLMNQDVIIHRTFRKDYPFKPWDLRNSKDMWGVFLGSPSGSCMTKRDGLFAAFLPRPSERESKFYKEFRFKSPEDALKSYLSFWHNEKHFKKIKKILGRDKE